MEIIDRTYETLEDLVDDHLGITFKAEKEALELGDPVVVSSVTLFTNLLSNFFETTINTPYTTTEVNTLFCTYIYPKYRDMCVCYWDDEDVQTENEKTFIIHLTNKIRKSYDEYKSLIDYWTNIKSTLMNQISSTSQTKFNDTPQTVTSSGVTSYDDTYNTNVTTSYASTDGGTKMTRFNEISDTIYDIYERWAEQVCKGLFIYEG